MPKRTVTEKMAEANRRNAQKSTGPRTPEGKERSSQNAFRHGLLARHIFHEKDPHESPDDFNTLLASLYDAHKPQGGAEVVLVQRIAVSYWRLCRAYRFEVRSIQDARDNCRPDPETGESPDPMHFVLPCFAEMDLLIRYEGLIDRTLNRCLAQLDRLQSRRQSRRQQQQEQDDDEAGDALFSRFLPDPMSFINNLQANLTNPNPPPPKPSAPNEAVPPASRPPSEISNLKSQIPDSPPPQSAIRNSQSAITKAPAPNEAVPPAPRPSSQMSNLKSPIPDPPPQSAIRNPKSAIQNPPAPNEAVPPASRPPSEISNLKSPIPDSPPQSAIRNPKSAITKAPAPNEAVPHASSKSEIPHPLGPQSPIRGSTGSPPRAESRGNPQPKS